IRHLTLHPGPPHVPLRICPADHGVRVSNETNSIVYLRATAGAGRRHRRSVPQLEDVASSAAWAFSTQASSKAFKLSIRVESRRYSMTMVHPRFLNTASTESTVPSGAFCSWRYLTSVHPRPVNAAA